MSRTKIKQTSSKEVDESQKESRSEAALFL
jgi:hypothetical protein